MIYKYRGDYDEGREQESIWDPLAAFWSAGPNDDLRNLGSVAMELQPGDITHYEVVISRSGFQGRPLSLAVYSPYNVCALVPRAHNSDEPFENDYILDKLGRRIIHKNHRCARLLISRLIGLAS